MIFDIMLPKHDGVEMCRQLQAQENQYSHPDADRPGRCQRQGHGA